MSSSLKNIILIIVLIIVLILIGFVLSTDSTKENDGFDVPEERSIAGLEINDRKQEILEMVYSGNTLTEEDKNVLLEVMSGEKFVEYGFTDAEKQQILSALNG